MMLLYVLLSIIALCSAQDGTDLAKLDNGNGPGRDKLQENVEALMRQVDELGLLLESYRKVILAGITEANDVCEFIERLSEDVEVKSWLIVFIQLTSTSNPFHHRSFLGYRHGRKTVQKHLSKPQRSHSENATLRIPRESHRRLLWGFSESAD